MRLIRCPEKFERLVPMSPKMDDCSPRLVLHDNILVFKCARLLVRVTADAAKKQVSSSKFGAQTDVKRDLAVINVEVELDVLAQRIFHDEAMMRVELRSNMRVEQCTESTGIRDRQLLERSVKPYVVEYGAIVVH